MSDRCCPRHDPITCAGFVICKTCGRRGYPSDAEWIDGDLILAAVRESVRPLPRAEYKRCGQLTALARDRASPDLLAREATATGINLLIVPRTPQ